MKDEKIKGYGSIPQLSLNRPVTVLMSFLALLVVGFIAYTQISVDLMPTGFTPPFLGVWTPYPNANPEEIEQLIARPIEEVVRTIKGVKSVNTNSRESGCWTFIQFAQSTDMDLAYSQLRDRMDRVKPDLPDDVERLYIRKWDNDDEPVMWIALIPDKELEDPYYFTEQMFKKPLEQIDGVANVEIYGADEKSIQIYIRQDAIKSYKINLYNIIENLRRDNFALSSGNIRSGEQKIFVRSVAKFRTLEDVRNIPIRGTDLKLKHIADIQYAVPEKTWRQRIDGKVAIQIGVYKESMANTVDICNQVKDKFEKEFLQDGRLAGIKTEMLFNQGEFITDSVDNLQNAGLWGGFFAFLVLYFFLRRLRMTLILNVAIPFSIMVSMTVLYFIGWTLNLITMMGLMISIGMVVDNSIVVLENIYYKRSEGLGDRTAAVKGGTEVSLAVTMATFTTIVVFLPLILMSGDMGFRFYMLRIGLPVIFSLLASLMVALVFIPLTASKILSKRKVMEPAIIKKLNEKYQRTLHWVLGHKVETLIILLVILFSSEFAKNNIAQTDNMEGNINDFNLRIQMPDNYTLDDAGRLVTRIEDSVKVKSEEYNVRTIDVRYRQSGARIHVFLHKEPNQSWYNVIYTQFMKITGLQKKTYMDRDQVVEDIKERLPKFPGVRIRTTWQQQSSGDDASMQINLFGDDTNKLAELAEEVERRLKRIEEIISVETDRETGSDEIRLVINREQVKKYGINPRVISGTVMYTLRGIQLPKYQTEEKEVNMLLQLREEDRQNLEQLKNITFFTSNGKEVPLDALASFEIKKGFGSIRRENGKTYLGIKANTTSDELSSVFSKVDKVMNDFEMPYGYSWTKGQRFRRMQESDDSMMFAIILSITFVFLLMGILFESFVLPLSVIISIPFSFVGAYWMLYLTGTPMDMMSQIGFIILIGIVVNNAIVLVDLVNRLRKQGYSRYDALMAAGKNRFRPILMTAFTTIGGLIPMAVGNTKMIGIPYAPMGRTIIGGLIFSTAVSLIAVPWAYTMFDDMRNYFRQLASGLLKGKTARESIPAANTEQ